MVIMLSLILLGICLLLWGIYIMSAATDALTSVISDLGVAVDNLIAKPAADTPETDAAINDAVDDLGGIVAKLNAALNPPA